MAQTASRIQPPSEEGSVWRTLLSWERPLRRDPNMTYSQQSLVPAAEQKAPSTYEQSVKDVSVNEEKLNLATSEQHEDSSGSLALATKILAIISKYRLPARDRVADKINEAYFLPQIQAKVSRNLPVTMCLPAFPFKSSNATSKVLGVLPDKAEEVALQHLNGLCATIARIYEPGASLMIISDGLVYNDLLGVSDRTVWHYGETLRGIAKEHNLKHINFSRLQDLAQIDVPEQLTEIAYICNATNFRHALLSQHSDPNFDASRRIHEDENTCLTYKSYVRFLRKDLEDVYPLGSDRSKTQYRKGIEYIAKQMLFRGDAFATAVRNTFSDYIRLSIHPSNMEKKISISVLPTDTCFTTSWHCCIGFRLDGTTTTGPRVQFEADDQFELIYRNGQPSFYVEKSPLLTWAEQKGGITCDPLYPSGLLIRPASGANALSITDIDHPKLRALAQKNSPIILRDFSQTRDRDLFVQTAHALGTPTAWKFGLVLEVKDQGTNTQGLNNVLSSEWMPFHYDGLFKTITQVQPNGKEALVSTPPNFQLFTSVTPSPKDTGFTLFSTSTNVFKHLAEYNLPPLDQLRRLTWKVSTTSFNSTNLRNIPLVVPHPTTGVPCLRFHEPWPQSRTKFEATNIEIENVQELEEGDWTSEGICENLAALLHDRRVAYYHAWEEGDLLVSDNILAHHTRSDFTAGCERELWRIHFD